MEKDCLRVAKECLDCQRFTAQRYVVHPLRLVTADLPMDGLAKDLAQMKTSKEGRNYILVIVDLCTRFIWLYAIADKASASITACLRELCAISGEPLRIQSDNGTEFKNLNMTTLPAELGIEHWFSSPYYPQVNGAAERAVRSVKEHLNAACRGDTSSWPKHLPAVQYEYNTTVHRRHGSTPFSLFFSRAHNPWKN
jgi:transposase InsO family protein